MAWCLLGSGAALFAALAFGLSYWRWYTYQYTTFDLAFYVQALWLTLHGHSGTTSILGVPLLGNHAEPIVYVALPLFALCPHPMLLPALQIAALASMPFTARRIALRLGLAEWPATLLALATLLMPASGYVAIHEFHPEALTAPLLLLLYEARQRGRRGWYAVWFLLTLACKENMALLLLAWQAVAWWSEGGWRFAWRMFARWSVVGRASRPDYPEEEEESRGRMPGLLPSSVTSPPLANTAWRSDLALALVAAAWFVLYTQLLAPWLNGGRVDYGNLYSHLTSLAAAAQALWRGLTQGNLAALMLLSSGGLVLLRPRWLLVAAPILLQHLLSWRSSEWTIWFHYAAPLVPLAWLAAAEFCAQARGPFLWAAPAVASLLLQPFCGPVRELVADWQTRRPQAWNRTWKAPIVEQIAAEPALTVVCGMPYLSHLAKRARLFPLHLVLKGTQTLSQLAPYEPDYQPDAVLLDYGDTATFNKEAGYYHPAKMLEGWWLPSSDELLLLLLSRQNWNAESINEVTLLRAAGQRPSAEIIAPAAPVASVRVTAFGGGVRRGVLALDWDFPAPRAVIPWQQLRLHGPAGDYSLPLGMAAPQIAGGGAHEERQLRFPPWLPRGGYDFDLVWYDGIRALWRKGTRDPFSGTAPVGELFVGESATDPSVQ